MPTIISHMAVPLAIGLALGKEVVPRRLMLIGMLASVLPDLDVIAFKLGIGYGTAFGHRGFSHSILFALLIALLGKSYHGKLRTSELRAALFLFVNTLSHSLLDAFTTGGMGVALLWPFSAERFFAPVQMIAVSPIGVSRFFTERGVAVIASEALWVWLPLMSVATCVVVLRRRGTISFAEEQNPCSGWDTTLTLDDHPQRQKFLPH